MKYLLILLFLFSFSSAWALPECKLTNQNSYKHNCKATFFYKNGSKYVGEWKDNKRHGKGTFFDINGEATKGYWDLDVPISVYKYKIENNKKTNSKSTASTCVINCSEAEIKKNINDEREKERKKLARKREIEERKREIEREKERKRLAIIRKENDLKVDNCLLKIFESEEEWSENNARRLCYMAIVESTSSLMTNCILDRGYKKPSSIYSSVFNVCESIASKPSWKDKIKYATPLSEYLNKLK